VSVVPENVVVYLYVELIPGVTYDWPNVYRNSATVFISVPIKEQHGRISWKVIDKFVPNAKPSKSYKSLFAAFRFKIINVGVLYFDVEMSTDDISLPANKLSVFKKKLCKALCCN
jgi:hypothetical protein